MIAYDTFLSLSALRARVRVCSGTSVVFDSATQPVVQLLWTVTAKPLCPWDSPGENTGVGCHALLQGILPTQGSKPGLPHCRWILYQLSHKGSPQILLLYKRKKKKKKIFPFLETIFLFGLLASNTVFCVFHITKA